TSRGYPTPVDTSADARGELIHRLADRGGPDGTGSGHPFALRDPHPVPARPPGILPIMKIGIGLDARLGLTFDQLRAAAMEAARFGFESVWTPAGGVPDSFHVCAAWSHDTSLRT